MDLPIPLITFFVVLIVILFVSFLVVSRNKRISGETTEPPFYRRIKLPISLKTLVILLLVGAIGWYLLSNGSAAGLLSYVPFTGGGLEDPVGKSPEHRLIDQNNDYMVLYYTGNVSMDISYAISKPLYPGQEFQITAQGLVQYDANNKNSRVDPNGDPYPVNGSVFLEPEAWGGGLLMNIATPTQDTPAKQIFIGKNSTVVLKENTAIVTTANGQTIEVPYISNQSHLFMKINGRKDMIAKGKYEIYIKSKLPK